MAGFWKTNFYLHYPQWSQGCFKLFQFTITRPFYMTFLAHWKTNTHALQTPRVQNFSLRKTSYWLGMLISLQCRFAWPQSLALKGGNFRPLVEWKRTRAGIRKRAWHTFWKVEGTLGDVVMVVRGVFWRGIKASLFELFCI